MKTIILDLDGTLIDSRHDLANAVNFALKEIGKEELPLARVLKHVGNGLTYLLENTIGPVEPPLMEKASKSFKDFYAKHLLDETVLYPGVMSCLEKFSTHAKMAVVTNKPYDFAVEIIKKLDIEKFMSVVYGGDSLPEHKPSPLPLLSAMEKMDGKASSSWMIGDGIQDVEAGKRAGFKTCVVRYGFGFHPDMLSLKPDCIIENFKDLELCLGVAEGGAGEIIK